jgi:hypothetical protein
MMKPMTSTRLAYGLLALTMILMTAGVAVAAERTTAVSAANGSASLTAQASQTRDCGKDATVKITKTTLAGTAAGSALAGRWEVRATQVMKGTLGYESGIGKVVDPQTGRTTATLKYEGVRSGGTTEGMLVARLKGAGQGTRGGQSVMANFTHAGGVLTWGSGAGTNHAIMVSGPCLPG